MTSENRATKFIVCVPDGCSDEPIDELGGRTPLEAADMPAIGELASRGEVGRAAVIPEGMPPGSDVGNMSILGYDPGRHHTGRAPIEAAALGLKLADDQIAFRCNLVTVGDDGTMVDFAGGHPDTAVATQAIEALGDALGTDEVSFHPGFQYRHIVVTPADWMAVDCVPPHDLSDKPAVWPTGAAAEPITDLMKRSRDVMAALDLDLAANQIWLWGQGPQPTLPAFADRWGLKAGLCTAVDLVRGLGRLADMDVVEVEGATGWYDTSYENKRDAALDALAAGADMFLIHVEASDEAGHAGNLEEKIKALESWDSRIVAPLVEEMDRRGERWRLLMLPDHPTPVRLKTHTTDPVPYLLYDSSETKAGGAFTEPGVADRPVVAGHELMAHLLQRRPVETAIS